ncbi:MAG: acyltransferase 3 [Pseudomonas sp.]|nr:acyltransferase 3 [Pseudomonas sp.]
MTSLATIVVTRQPSKFPSQKYRPDIDGLRAVAVLSVVAFHAFPEWVPRGYIGVDIFFVISGFLISQIIFKKLEIASFSLLDFYSRRICRILPALIVMLMSCLVFGWIALFASEYKSLGAHIVAGTTFTSNFLLMSESSYFDIAARVKPLLHLWSLGVEEQFYIVWPIILIAAYRVRLSPLTTVSFLLTASFVVNLLTPDLNEAVRFYSPMSRAWELLFGAMIACITAIDGFTYKPIQTLQSQVATAFHKHRARIRSATSVVGLCLIGYGLTTIKGAESTRGWGLYPAIGSGLVILSGETSLVNRVLLSHKTLVWIGLISFPLYLWHWPLLSLAQMMDSELPSLSTRLILVMSSLLLAWLTYKIIELPVRHQRNTRKLSIIILVITLAIGVSGHFIEKNDGLPSRDASMQVERFTGDLGRETYLHRLSTEYHRCQDQQLLNLSPIDPLVGHRCYQSKLDTQVGLIVIGDSHAEHIFPGLAKYLSAINSASFIQPGIPTDNNPMFSEAFKYIEQTDSIKIVILSALWESKILPGQLNAGGDLIRTIDALTSSGKTVFLLEDIPGHSFDPQKCKYGRIFSTGNSKCISSAEEVTKRNSYSQSVLKTVINNSKKVTYIRLSDLFCKANSCSMVIGHTIIYRDSNHLNIDGSEIVGQYIAQKLAL